MAIKRGPNSDHEIDESGEKQGVFCEFSVLPPSLFSWLKFPAWGPNRKRTGIINSRRCSRGGRDVVAEVARLSAIWMAPPKVRRLPLPGN